LGSLVKIKISDDPEEKRTDEAVEKAGRGAVCEKKKIRYLKGRSNRRFHQTPEKRGRPIFNPDFSGETACINDDKNRGGRLYDGFFTRKKGCSYFFGRKKKGFQTHNTTGKDALRHTKGICA